MLCPEAQIWVWSIFVPAKPDQAKMISVAFRGALVNAKCTLYSRTCRMVRREEGSARSH